MSTPTLRDRAKGALDRAGLLSAAQVVHGSLRTFTPAAVPREVRALVSGAPDGLPVPPARLVWLVIGHGWRSVYLESGRQVADGIVANLERHGYPWGGFTSVLDFGCGCGRILRHLLARGGPRMHGSDYNARLVAWCQAHLRGAEFRVNGLAPPLPWPDGSFDLVYAQSVFTHLDGDLQRRWMDEMARVLRPGGILHATTQGDAFLPALAGADLARYRAGDLVVLAPDAVGRNICGAFQTPEQVRREMARGWDVAGHVPGTPTVHAEQDAWLFRKP